MNPAIDYWRWTNLLGLSAFCILIPFAFGKRIPLSGRLLWAYALLSSLWVFQNPFKYAAFGLEFSEGTAQAFSQILLIPLGTLLIPGNLFVHYRFPFLCLGIFESLAIFNWGSGLMQASSFDGGFVASMCAMSPGVLQVLFIIALVSSDGATGFAVVAAQMTGFLTGQAKKYWIALPIFAAFAWYFQGARLLNTNGRYAFWRVYATWWNDNELWWTG